MINKLKKKTQKISNIDFYSKKVENRQINIILSSKKINN